MHASCLLSVCCKIPDVTNRDLRLSIARTSKEEKKPSDSRKNPGTAGVKVVDKSPDPAVLGSSLE